MTNKTLKKQIFDSISTVYGLAEDCKFNNSFFEVVDKELLVLSNYFHVTKQQAFFISIVFALDFKKQKVDLDAIASHLDCCPLKVLEHYDLFVELIEKQLFRKSFNYSYHGHTRTKSSNLSIEMNELIVNKILSGELIPESLDHEFKCNDIFNFLEKFCDSVEQVHINGISTEEMFIIAKRYIDENPHLKLLEKIRTIGLSIPEKVLFLYLIWNYLEGSKSLSLERTFKSIYDQPLERILQIQKIFEKENNLIIEELVDIGNAEFLEDAELELQEKAFDLMKESGILFFEKNKPKSKNILQPTDIPIRNLIFDNQEMKQLDLLKSILAEENFRVTQERLNKKSLPKGVTVLLHGTPGTGKTESVLQIAKATNRQIMKVEISESRSMWFGESEKIIKKIFNDYKVFSKNQKITPILFMNEADALISKRRDSNQTNVSDTENRIQNILLEEIENFEGIFIATTNLATNMDKAFERRFLFKIEFQKPSVTAKSQIWKSKMPHLTDEDCELLATEFDFSGGQIDNIVRKNEINEILYGHKINLNTLQEFCREETLSGSHSKIAIGFKKERL